MSAFTATVLSSSGLAGPTIKASGFAGPNGTEILLVTGTGSYDTGGSTITITSSLADYCFGGVVIGQDASDALDRTYRIIPDANKTS